jgi:hypothetical protein
LRRRACEKLCLVFRREKEALFVPELNFNLAQELSF